MRLLTRALSAGALLGLLALAVAGHARAQDEAKSAKITVKLVEDEDVTLKVKVKDKEKEVAGGTGSTRSFETPPLKADAKAKYSYTFIAVWKPNNYETYTRTRKVYVKRGESVTLDMTKKDPNNPDDIFIRYVPTPTEFIDAMMKLGKVGKNDVVYDLGCGDGRIVIAAVSKYGAKRGVGIDLDQKRLDECKENAEKAKVTDKLEFRKGDVMKVPDLDKATVVCIYLSDGLNEQLWPILQKNCKPGTRIVTHRFKMGKHEPEKSVDVESDEAGFHYKEQVHLWTVKGDDKKDKDKKDKEDKDK